MMPRAEGEEPAPTTWRLRLRDRPGSVERVLSILRRRVVRLDALSLERADESLLTLKVVLAIDPADEARIRAEIDGLEDVAAAQGPRSGRSAAVGPGNRND